MPTRTLLLVFLIFLAPFDEVSALRPMVHYHDLVAGGGDRGFQDGPFDSALFNEPAGLAFHEDGNRLFVADRNNHRVRVVHLGENNRVETLAGSAEPGKADGPLKKASFNKPTALAFLPGNRLVVYDSGNFLFRLIDLKAGTVSTLAGHGRPDREPKDGKALEVAVGGTWNLLYHPAEDTLYFSMPEDGAIKRLDLKTGHVSSPLRGNVYLPQPTALCLYKGGLCAADRHLPNVYQVALKPDPEPPVLTPVGNVEQGRHILALASWGPKLYAIQDGMGPSWVRFGGEPIKLMSVWGEAIEKKQTNQPLLFFTGHDRIGFVASPHEERKFYLASGFTGNVISLKDYDFNRFIELHNLTASGLCDFDYPTQKPPKTFRILVVGDSLAFSTSYEDQVRWGWGNNRMENMPKRLELMLNTQAAMDDVPLNYEVLALGHGSEGFPSFLWPYYEVPGIVAKFDIDLVLHVFATVPTDGYSVYFSSPLTEAGIPQWPRDPEYLLKPWKEKIPQGLAKNFYEKCLAKEWVKPVSDTQLLFERLTKLITDEPIRNDLVELMGKPIGMLGGQLRKMKTSAGKPVRSQMLLILSNSYEKGSGTLALYRSFWKEIAEKQRMAFMDLVNFFTAFSPTYSQLDESGSWRHYTANGTYLYSYVIAHQLIRSGIIPFPVPVRTGP